MNSNPGDRSASVLELRHEDSSESGASFRCQKTPSQFGQDRPWRVSDVLGAADGQSAGGVAADAPSAMATGVNGPNEPPELRARRPQDRQSSRSASHPTPARSEPHLSNPVSGNTEPRLPRRATQPMQPGWSHGTRSGNASFGPPNSNPGPAPIVTVVQTSRDEHRLSNVVRPVEDQGHQCKAGGHRKSKYKSRMFKALGLIAYDR